MRVNVGTRFPACLEDELSEIPTVFKGQTSLDNLESTCLGTLLADVVPPLIFGSSGLLPIQKIRAFLLQEIGWQALDPQEEIHYPEQGQVNPRHGKGLSF